MQEFKALACYLSKVEVALYNLQNFGKDIHWSEDKYEIELSLQGLKLSLNH